MFVDGNDNCAVDAVIIDVVVVLILVALSEFVDRSCVAECTVAISKQ